MNGYCPLCKKYLIYVDGLVCPTRVHFGNGYQRSHFEQDANNTSTWCFPPFLVINNLDKNISQVMITKHFEGPNKRARPIWEHLFETELIAPGDVERLKKRIKLLTIFS
jgi:hypothetical protein